MALWILADTHFSHARIIDYCKRPFDSVEEMDRVLVENWNKKVSAKDDMLHLGDWGFGGLERMQALRNKLRCSRVYIKKGNHDSKGRLRALGLTIEQTLIWGSGDRKQLVQVHTNHYPVPDWQTAPSTSRAACHLYGHVHNSPHLHPPKSFCVSVENIGYAPMRYEEAIERAIAAPAEAWYGPAIQI